MEHKKKQKKRGVVIPILLVAMASGGLVLGLLGVAGLSLTPETLYHKLLLRLLRLLGYLAVGLLVGQLIESLGWTTWLARLVRPLTRLGRLKEESGAAFVTGFVSGIVANTTLMTYHEQGRVTRKELILTYLINNGLPMFLVHLPTTVAIVAALAREAGLVYLCMTFASACIRSLAALLYCRLTLPALQPGGGSSLQSSVPAPHKSRQEIWDHFRDRFTRLILYTVPIYVLIFVLNQWGLFVWLRNLTVRWISSELFPIEAAGVVIFALAAEFSSGMAAAGVLLDEGTLTVKQTALALIMGSIVATPIRAVRHQLPTHAGIFDLKLGVQLLTLSQSLRVASLIIVAAVYAVWW